MGHANRGMPYEDMHPGARHSFFFAARRLHLAMVSHRVEIWTWAGSWIMESSIYSPPSVRGLLDFKSTILILSSSAHSSPTKSEHPRSAQSQRIPQRIPPSILEARTAERGFPKSPRKRVPSKVPPKSLRSPTLERRVHESPERPNRPNPKRVPPIGIVFFFFFGGGGGG